MTYFDTSALIKRFVAEKGSAAVQAMVARREPLATSRVTYAEVYAGLGRRRREGHLSERGHALASRQFEADWVDYVRVDLRDEVLTVVRELVRRHPLRALDAIHLASALVLRTGLTEEIAFAAADARLLRTAEAEGLRALNVETVE